MASTKSNNIMYWASTGLISAFTGIMPLLTVLTAPATFKEGLVHLGYPEYFGLMLVCFEVLGAVTLILPQISGRFKEWAYAGYGILFISASVSHFNIDGPGGKAITPLVFIALLALSYMTYHKRSSAA